LQNHPSSPPVFPSDKLEQALVQCIAALPISPISLSQAKPSPPKASKKYFGGHHGRSRPSSGSSSRNPSPASKQAPAGAVWRSVATPRAGRPHRAVLRWQHLGAVLLLCVLAGEDGRGRRSPWRRASACLSAAAHLRQVADGGRSSGVLPVGSSPRSSSSLSPCCAYIREVRRK
jgi:hypothetical protein